MSTCCAEEEEEEGEVKEKEKEKEKEKGTYLLWLHNWFIVLEQNEGSNIRMGTI